MRGVLPEKRLSLVIAAITLIVVAVAGVAYARSNAPSAKYQTTTVTVGTVTQTLGMAGNLMPTTVADVNFAVAGQVATIPVQVGEDVTSGEVLATLVATPLQDALTISQAQLASAQAQLSQAQAGATPGQLAQGNDAIASAQLALSSAQTNAADNAALNAEALTIARSQVVTDQAQVSSDTATLITAQQQQAAACGTASDGQQCQAANAQVATDQQQLSKDSSTLQAAQYGVETVQLKNTQSTNQGNEQIAAAQQQLASARADLAALEAGGTPAQIQSARDQVTIDQVNVQEATKNLADATLTSPANGVVAQINTTVGAQVSPAGGAAANATPHFVIIGAGTFSVVGTVSDAQINQVAIGQSAEIVPAGATQSLLGTVTAVAPEATISAGVATFPVTVTVSNSTGSIRAGASAAVNIIINRAVGVLTVPTSAIHTTTSGSTVDVLRNGQSVPVSVQLGASDATTTQILSGLSQGETVILASITSQVPATTILPRKGKLGAAAFPGGGGATRGGKGARP